MNAFTGKTKLLLLCLLALWFAPAVNVSALSFLAPRPLQQTNTNAKALAERLAIPSYLQELVDNPGVQAKPELIKQLTVADKEVLTKIYQMRTNAFDRINLVFVLGQIGDEQTLELFKKTLFEDYAGRTFFDDYRIVGIGEEDMLILTVNGIAGLAERFDSAFELLKQATDQWFWKEKVKWTSDKGADTVGIITGSSIQALGLTGRKEVPEILERLKKGELRNRTGGDDPHARTFYGDIVSAAYYYECRYKLRKSGGSTVRSFDDFDTWCKSDSGKKWDAWYNSARKRQ